MTTRAQSLAKLTRLVRIARVHRALGEAQVVIDALLEHDIERARACAQAADRVTLDLDLPHDHLHTLVAYAWNHHPTPELGYPSYETRGLVYIGSTPTRKVQTPHGYFLWEQLEPIICERRGVVQEVRVYNALGVPVPQSYGFYPRGGGELVSVGTRLHAHFIDQTLSIED